MENERTGALVRSVDPVLPGDDAAAIPFQQAGQHPFLQRLAVGSLGALERHRGAPIASATNDWLLPDRLDLRLGHACTSPQTGHSQPSRSEPTIAVRS